MNKRGKMFMKLIPATLPRYHPEFLDMQSKFNKAQQRMLKLLQNQIILLTEEMSRLSIETGNSVFRLQSAYVEQRLTSTHQTPSSIIKDLQLCCICIEEALKMPRESRNFKVIEMIKASTEPFTAEILHHQHNATADPPEKGETLDCLAGIDDDLGILLRFLFKLLKDPYFDAAVTEEIDADVKNSLSQLKGCKKKVGKELKKNTRLKMCTIGSLIQLAPKGKERNKSAKQQSQHLKETVVVIDESGCIPSYELLSLSQLKRSIACIVVVGDKHQLPPYNPGCDIEPLVTGRTTFISLKAPKGRRVAKLNKLQSILDVSRPSQGKVSLSSQYRVPRDIANILNGCIYSGKYNTPKDANVPEFGFMFVHVPYCEGHQKYVNENEIKATLDIIARKVEDGKTNILVLTPVSMT
jgi:AAA domain